MMPCSALFLIPYNMTCGRVWQPLHWLCLMISWRHQMEIFSALPDLCDGDSSVTGEFPSQSQRRRALMPVIWESISLIIMSLKRKTVPCFFQKQFQLTTAHHCRGITENANVCLCFHRNIQHDKSQLASDNESEFLNMICHLFSTHRCLGSMPSH